MKDNTAYYQFYWRIKADFADEGYFVWQFGRGLYPFLIEFVTVLFFVNV